MTTQTTMTTRPAMAVRGVLDVDGLHLADTPLAPIRGAIRHVGGLQPMGVTLCHCTANSSALGRRRDVNGMRRCSGDRRRQNAKRQNA